MTTTHRIRWYVIVPGNAAEYGGERLRHTATMRGSWPGWDADCTCGWKSRHAGEIKARVAEAVADHKAHVAMMASDDAYRELVEIHASRYPDYDPVTDQPKESYPDGTL